MDSATFAITWRHAGAARAPSTHESVPAACTASPPKPTYEGWRACRSNRWDHGVLAAEADAGDASATLVAAWR